MSKPAKKNNYITPDRYLAAARKVFGTYIHLDVASDYHANQHVKAAKVFTRANDGLKQAWIAKTVWCNPPGSPIPGKNTIGAWLEKAASEYERGNFAEACFLAYNLNASTNWFQRTIGNYPVCFPNHRIKFLGDDLVPDPHPTKENLIIYIGPSSKHSLFEHVFGEIGAITPPYKRR